MRELACNLVRSKEIAKNFEPSFLRGKFYDYKAAISSYDKYFKLKNFEEELKCSDYDSWLEFLRQKKLFDKKDERNGIIELREKAVGNVFFTRELTPKMKFYRIYFEETEFETEEKMLEKPDGYELWKKSLKPENTP